jgi:hypothetical protein
MVRLLLQAGNLGTQGGGAQSVRPEPKPEFSWEYLKPKGGAVERHMIGFQAVYARRGIKLELGERLGCAKPEGLGGYRSFAYASAESEVAPK